MEAKTQTPIRVQDDEGHWMSYGICEGCKAQVEWPSLYDGHGDFCGYYPACRTPVPQVEPFYSTGDTLTEVTSIAGEAANKWLLRAGLHAADVLSTQVTLAACVVDEMAQYGYVITLTVQVPRWKAQATA